MRLGIVLGVLCAILLHVGFILFGGLLIPSAKENHGTVQTVELLSEAETEEEKNQDQPEESTPEEIQAEEEPPPDAEELIRNLETPMSNEAPALDAASLSAIEATLAGLGGAAGDFGIGADLAGGGVIGGTGRPGQLSDEMERAFSLDEIDQKPRPVYQVAPNYPSHLRGKRIEGEVILIFEVDATGRVQHARVESSNNPAFEKPALDAVRKWKYEPAVRGGERVACKIRQPIVFPPS